MDHATGKNWVTPRKLHYHDALAVKRVTVIAAVVAGAGAGQKVATTPGGNGALDPALREAEDVRPRVGRGVAEADEGAASPDVLHVGREGVLELDVADEPRARLAEPPAIDVGSPVPDC